jgi:hypothetical protein
MTIDNFWTLVMKMDRDIIGNILSLITAGTTANCAAEGWGSFMIADTGAVVDWAIMVGISCISMRR